MFWLRISGAPPNFRRHNPSLIIATGAAPGLSSAGLNSRPISGRTPSTAKKPEERKFAFNCSASPFPVRLKEKPRASPIEVKVRFSLRQSRKLGYEIDPVGKFGLLSSNATSSSGLEKGSGLRRTPFTIEKTA